MIFLSNKRNICNKKGRKLKYLHLIYFSEPIPECTQNSECPNDKTCYNQRCVDPCTLDSCGFNSRCHVQMHRAVCVCNEGFTGNPQQYCGESTFFKYFLIRVNHFYIINIMNINFIFFTYFIFYLC